MTRRFWVYSGDRPSNGAKTLAALSGFLRLRPGKFHKLKGYDVIINWGTTQPLADKFGISQFVVILNMPDKVASASNKLLAFTKFKELDVKTVDWTDDQTVAQGWSNNEFVVVVRNKLTGHSGNGIVIIEKNGIVPVAPLYTKYIFKEYEYRVHVCSGQVIDTQKKIRDPDRTPTTWKVRSHDNGFIFARNGIIASAARDDTAIKAIEALGLNFGAVDIVEDKKGFFYVLEVNTAPGLEGQTIESYGNAFRQSI